MKPHEPTVTDVALGVKQVSVGAPFRSHVYLIDGPDGARTVTGQLERAAVEMNPR
jgi:hypothetical protein